MRPSIDRDNHTAMNDHVDMQSPLSRAHWCGNFCCSEAELAYAVRVMDSTEIGLVGLYLAHAPARQPRFTDRQPINTAR